MVSNFDDDNGHTNDAGVKSIGALRYIFKMATEIAGYQAAITDAEGNGQEQVSIIVPMSMHLHAAEGVVRGQVDILRNYIHEAAMYMLEEEGIVPGTHTYNEKLRQKVSGLEESLSEDSPAIANLLQGRQLH